MSKKEKKPLDWQTDVQLDIPEDEIWTYQVPGLAAPHINKPYKYYNFKKAIFVIVTKLSRFPLSLHHPKSPFLITSPISVLTSVTA